VLSEQRLAKNGGASDETHADLPRTSKDTARES
jgi:hypothetical protein